MRHCLLFFSLILAFFSAAQKGGIDRSNYQLLWEISRADMQGNAYLFGTYHSNDNDVFEFPDSLYSALLMADAVVLETDITEFMLDESTIIPNLGYNKSYLLKWVVPARSTDKITYTAYGSDEGRPQFIDMYFKQIADNCSKSFYPLETIEDQLQIGLNNELDPNAPRNIKMISRQELKQKYLEGNARDLHKYTRNSTLEYLDLYKDLIVDRNFKMAEGIDTLVHQHNSTFIAVGASHLLGSKGIVPLLRKKGYTVRAVNADFSNDETKDEFALRKCANYNYVDQRFGAKLRFGGKPAIKELGNADRLIQYQELGQGNTYSLSIYNYGVEVNLENQVRNYFKDPKLSTVQFDSLAINKDVKAYQGLITNSDGNKEWIRIFKKGNVLYTLSAKGGYRFINSNRYLKFFDGFQFTQDEIDIRMNQTVISESKTMLLKFPKNYFSENRVLDFDKVWDVKWINPFNGEILYAYESIMTDNTISYDNKEFGDYILARYHPDSVKIDNKSQIEGESISKSYIAHSNGYLIHGRIRQIGNVIQFIEYTGKDEVRRKEFLRNFDALQAFPTTKQNKKITNLDFETFINKGDFKLEIIETEKYEFQETKNYNLVDSETSIAYNVMVKKFHPWSFSQKSIKELLIDQIQWKNDLTVKKIDTTFELNGPIPTMNFSIYYPGSENRFKGKVTLIGKTIFISNMTYPEKANMQYKNIPFLDSLKLFEKDSVSIQKLDIPLLKNEIMVNGGSAVEDLIIEGHVGDSVLHLMLDWPAQFWDNFDEEGILLSSVVYGLDWKTTDRNLYDYWKERTNAKNVFFTISVLYNLQEKGNSADYMKVVNETKEDKSNEIDFYRFLAINDPKNDFLIEVWPVFSTMLEDSLSWNISFMLPELMNKQFFQDYFTSAKFVKAVTSDTQPPWAAFRYFEIMFEYGLPKDQFSKMLKVWNKNKNDHKTGSIAAWRTIIGEKISGKEKRLIKKDAAVAISYSKVMAVSENPVYDLLSFEQMIGYIAFDHYKDAYFDKDKSLTYIENKVISAAGNQFIFAFYKIVENDKTYYMAREIPKNKILPSYGGFGENTFFIYGSEEYQPEKIEEELVKKIEKK
ncbi:TraB/GumN family protein [Brumimicrobium mesophilum]|uniref:TraB/GumN family protein n=1 Tax=Brumimicrobium mesophilum TaxID=392717 RepID=UPI000D141F85|nr:TraB/GumN family protein [Brumimicrobium mesophilum]